MVRPTKDGRQKQPISAHETRPVDYEPPAGTEDPNEYYWRWRWQVPAVWAAFKEAQSYKERHSDIEGLSFVLHPAGEHEPKRRIICLDFDKCFDDTGILDPAVDGLVDLLGTFAERSRSGRGLHVFLYVDNCPAFVNIKGAPVGGCKVDVLCSAQVAVTGDVFGPWKRVVDIAFDELQSLPFFEFKPLREKNAERPDWWTDDPLDDVKPEHLYLVDQINGVTAVEGQGGSKVFFAAACEVLRHGITGRAAEALLRTVPADPPFPDWQIRRTLECAYNHTVAAGEFNTAGIDNEFADLSATEAPKDEYEIFGFRRWPVDVLEGMDLKLEWLIEDSFVGEGALFIGGREKTFKTGIAADLLVSLATGTPFLGQFPVAERRTSVLFTAEIGLARAKYLIQSIRIAKGIPAGAVRGIDIVDTVPSFQLTKTGVPMRPREILGLKRYFKTYRPQVAVFDPLYFAMGGASVGDMYEIGTVLRHITEICKSEGVWPIFCHHARKDSNKEFEPMDLSDFYGSGVSAFARQWMLLSHSEPFRDGKANLTANVGGSSQGSRGIWQIVIDEGQPDDIMDRRWDVTVKTGDDVKAGPSVPMIEEALKLHGPCTAENIAFFADTNKQMILPILRNLARSGEITMVGNKYKLPEDIS